VDDSLDFLEAAVSVMADSPEIEVVGCANSGREALDRVPDLRPDVVLIDLHMRDLDGLPTTRLIKRGVQAPVVIAISLDDRPETRLAALRNGADGFVGKPNYYDEVLPTIRSVVQRTDRGDRTVSQSAASV
jgi:DNA-binding NarL/FixJ family response regulator